MTLVLIDEVPSAASALTGTICMITWPLFPSRRAMLLVQLGIGIGFGLHYALEQAFTAAVVNALGALQVTSSLLFGTSPRLKWIGYALIPAILAACVLTWNGAPSLLAAVGMAFIAVGRVQINPSAMRLLVLLGTPFWLAHDLLIGSPLVIADVLSLLMGAVALLLASQAYLRRPPPHGGERLRQRRS